MADLDMSDVLSDPDLIEPFGLVRIRRVQTVGTDGIAIDAEVSDAFAGVVTAGKGDKLNRIAEGARAMGNMTVTTSTELLPNTPDRDADIVVWQGKRYVVESIADYRNFGYIQAYCDLLPLRG
ncbi:MAG: hypothetical protein KGL90_15455 [Burkholderiales bacterium]|nr:hypothetical protein [Burkholderiales bacterium]